MSRRRNNQAKLKFEKLEDRNLLAGDVDAFVDPAGDLVIVGDGADNAIWLKQDAAHVHAGDGTVWVWGDGTTTINGQNATVNQPLGIPGLTRHIQVDLNAGNDTFYAIDIHAPGSFRVVAGSGNDDVHVEFAEVSDTLRVFGGHGSDNLYAEGVTAGGRIVVRGQNGADEIYVSSANTDYLLIHAGGGKDGVYVNDLAQVGDGRIHGGRGRGDYLGSNRGYNASRSLGSVDVRGMEEFGQQPGGQDVMEAKLNDAIGLLGQRRGEQQHMQAIDQIMESLFTSNLVPLPTNTSGDPLHPDQQDFDEHQARIEEAINALDDHLNNRRRVGNDDTRAEAADAKNFLQLTQEALQVIASQTAHCDPDGLTGPGCQLLQADDEGGTVIDEVLQGIFSRQLRSPFPIIFEGSVGPVEHSFTTEALADGECAAIVKEFQGVKVVVTPRTIPIWVEPWFARARIVGFQTVWAFEFVPAEFIKTVSVCNVSGTVETNVTSLVVHDRALMHFWRFFD